MKISIRKSKKRRDVTICDSIARAHGLISYDDRNREKLRKCNYFDVALQKGIHSRFCIPNDLRVPGLFDSTIEAAVARDEFSSS